MRTDRVTIMEAEDEIESGTWDLVIMEELSRAYRNPRHQYAFVQDAVDAGTRVICIGDNLDTADAEWEIALGTATLRHGLAIPDTRRRVRRTANFAFHRGRMVIKFRFGYRKLSEEEADSGRFGPKGLRIAKVPEATPIIREMRRRVLDGSTYCAVAHWLNDEEIAPGPYSGRTKWTGRLVADLLRDPILGGTRTFGVLKSQPLYRTGKSRRRRNPDAPETEHYPELAHLSESEHAELLRTMKGRAARHPRAAGPEHPLYNRPRSRAIWPGQHPRCAICGAPMYRFCKDELKCRNAFMPGAVPCWNHVQVNCQIVRDKVLAMVMGHCEQVPGFRRALVDAAWAELEAQRRRRSLTDRNVDDEVAELEKRAANLAQAIAKGGRLEALVQQLTEVDRNLKDARRRRSDPTHDQRLGTSQGTRAEVDRHLKAALAQVARSSYTFADLMRRILPEFSIVPVQAVDGGQVRPRARYILRLSGSDSEAIAAGQLVSPLGDVSGTLDLFEPPAYIRAMPACVAAKQVDPAASLNEIAAKTGYNRMTVKRALAFARQMAAEGLNEPYRELTQCPAAASRWRHRHVS
jgi:DNA invertase Pin-like site-specific DNA recombinase